MGAHAHIFNFRSSNARAASGKIGLFPPNAQTHQQACNKIIIIIITVILLLLLLSLLSSLLLCEHNSESVDTREDTLELPLLTEWLNVRAGSLMASCGYHQLLHGLSVGQPNRQTIRSASSSSNDDVKVESYWVSSSSNNHSDDYERR